MKTRFITLVCFAALILPAKLWAAGLALVGKTEVVIRLDNPSSYSYTVKTTGGSPALKYTWQNTASSTFPDDSTIIYTPKKIGFDTIYCTVSDQTNASIKKTIVFYNTDICSPSIFFDKYTAIVGDTITVSLKINNITAQCEYTNFQAHIVYDSTMLDYVDATMKNSVMPSGDLLCEELTKDSLSFGFTPSWNDINAVLSGNGTMVDFRFIAKKIGTSKLLLDEPILIGHLVNSTTNGTVTILPKPTLQIKPDTAFVNDTLTTYISVSNIDAAKTYADFQSNIIFDTTALHFVDASMINTLMPDAQLTATFKDANTMFAGFIPNFSNPTASFNTSGNLIRIRLVGKNAGSFKMKLIDPFLDGILLDTTSAVCVVKKRPMVCNPSISSDNYTTIVDDTVTISLKIDNITAQCGYNNYQAFLKYDSTMLRYLDSKMNNSIMPDALFLCEELTNELLSFSSVPSFDNPDVVLQGNGTLVDFRFVTKKIGTTKLLFRDPYFNYDLITSITNGTITILPKPEIALQAATVCQKDTIHMQIVAKNLMDDALNTYITAVVNYPTSVEYSNYSIAGGIMARHHATVSDNKAGQLSISLQRTTVINAEELFKDGSLITLNFIAKESGVAHFSCQNISLNTSSVADKTIDVTSNKTPSVQINSATICRGELFYFYPEKIESQTYTLWTRPDGTTIETGRLLASETGIYTMMQRFDNGCENFDTAQLTVHTPNANANFSISATDTLHGTYQFTAESKGVVEWTLIDKTTVSENSFERQFTTAQTGDVCLVARDENACTLKNCKSTSFAAPQTLYVVKGTMTGGDAKELVAGKVIAYYLRGSEFVALDSTAVNADGSYQLSSLPKGNYTLKGVPETTNKFQTTYFYNSLTLTNAEKFTLTGNGRNFDIILQSVLTGLTSNTSSDCLLVNIQTSTSFVEIGVNVAEVDRLIIISSVGQLVCQLNTVTQQMFIDKHTLANGFYSIVALKDNNIITHKPIIIEQ